MGIPERQAGPGKRRNILPHKTAKTATPCRRDVATTAGYNKQTNIPFSSFFILFKLFS